MHRVRLRRAGRPTRSKNAKTGLWEAMPELDNDNMTLLEFVQTYETPEKPPRKKRLKKDISSLADIGGAFLDLMAEASLSSKSRSSRGAGYETRRFATQAWGLVHPMVPGGFTLQTCWKNDCFCRWGRFLSNISDC